VAKQSITINGRSYQTIFELFSFVSLLSLLAILWAGFTCGTLDISAALVVYRYFGHPPMRLVQGIAVGVLDSRSFQDGLPHYRAGYYTRKGMF